MRDLEDQIAEEGFVFEPAENTIVRRGSAVYAGAALGVPPVFKQYTDRIEAEADRRRADIAGRSDPDIRRLSAWIRNSAAASDEREESVGAR